MEVVSGMGMASGWNTGVLDAKLRTPRGSRAKFRFTHATRSSTLESLGLQLSMVFSARSSNLPMPSPTVARDDVRCFAARWLRAAALALVFMLAAAASSKRAEAATTASEFTHVVERGQYLSLIAKRYHTSADAIRRRNALKKGDAIRPGTTLFIVETTEHRAWREHQDRKLGKSHADGRPPATTEPTPRPRHARGQEALRSREGKDSSREGKRSASGAGSLATNTERYARKPARRGQVTVARQAEVFRGQLVGKNGQLVQKAAEKLDWLLRSVKDDEPRKIDRRLLKLLAEMSDHFGGRRVEIVSGFRPYSPKQFTRNSRHNHGQAIDLRIVGVPNIALYEHCVTFDHVGCGYYPNSHFIHMDVRDLKTRWVDYSRPGQAPIYARGAARDRAVAAAREGDKKRVAEPPPAASQPPSTPPAAKLTPNDAGDGERDDDFELDE